MLTPNPTDDRLKFILKTYGAKKPDVVRDMISVVANTVGVDRWAEELAERTQKADPNFSADVLKWGPSSLTNVPGLNPPPTQFLTVVIDLLSTLPQFKARHRADPLFPWMATQLAKAYEPIARIVAGKNDPEVRGAPSPADVYRDVLRKMRRGGTMLAQWYEAKRPNLGQYDFGTAWAEASRWSEEEGPVPQGEVVVELEDGWTAQKLTTKEQLDVEGEKMQHCVGSYADEVKRGDTTIYSLRDSKGHPHVTIEVKDDRIRQIQGKQNNRPAAKYEKYVTEFKTWCEENDIAISNVPPELQAYADAIEAHGNYDDDDDNDYLADYAREWSDNTSDADEAAEWMKTGLMYNEAELAGALRGEDVTPEIYAKFPVAVYRQIGENGGVPSDLDKMVAVALMTMKLVELLPQRDPPLKPSAQTELFEREPSVPKRQPGQDPQGEVWLKHRWAQNGKHHLGFKSLSFGEWHDVYDKEEEEYRWLYPAEEWLASKYSPDPDDDAYVGQWFIHRFTPEQADEWWDIGIEDGNVAAELRDRRVTPKMVEELEQAGGDVREMSAQKIIDTIDDAGVRRNPKRTSKRRVSRPRR